jgi:hypothetical protein
MQRPDFLTVDEVNAGFPKGCDVIVPCRLSGVRCVYTRKDDNGKSACANGLADCRECLVVSDTEGEFGDHVGGSRYNRVAIHRGMRARLIGQPWIVSDWQAGRGLEAIEFAGRLEPSRRCWRCGDGDGPAVADHRFDETFADVLHSASRGADQAQGP